MSEDVLIALLLQFIPARGRKQFTVYNNVRVGRCCNLSPRGDGNRFTHRMLFISWVAIYPREGTETSPVLIARSFSVRLQFIPARGRKPTHQHHWFCRHPPVAIYPREGTETRQSIPCIPQTCSCNLSPRGDGNKRM